MSGNVPGQISADGLYYWNGQDWKSTLSPDGTHRWNGSAWVPSGPPPPPAAPSGPPSTPAPPWMPLDAPGVQPQAYAQAVPAVPGYGMPARPAPNRASLGWQFGGSAAWSIGWGVLAIAVPLISPQHTYFVLLPLFGLWRAWNAFRFGRTAGAVLGFVLNIVAGLISLLASGLLTPPSS